jgi:RNA polymerase sigma-70 factor (ECF subfamily)
MHCSPRSNLGARRATFAQHEDAFPEASFRRGRAVLPDLRKDLRTFGGFHSANIALRCFLSEVGKAREDYQMIMLASEHRATTPGDMDVAELESGLVKLMPFLCAFARTLARDRELAEDLTQEALAKVWRSRQSFSRGTNLKAWVFTILRNEFYSHRRRAWRQAPWDAEQAETIAAAPGEQHWAVELSSTVRAMQALPDAQREALMLVAVGGLSYDDAAVLTNVAAGTTKSRVARARKSLKDILESRSPLPSGSRPANGAAMSELFSQLALTQSCAHERQSRTDQSSRNASMPVSVSTGAVSLLAVQ